MHSSGEGHGAFFNDDDAATVAAFTERLMPGAPGKPGARDAGVLNYIDLALAGAYADLQDFYRRGLAQLDVIAARPTANLSCGSTRNAGRGDAALEDGKAGGFTWPTAQAFFNTMRTHTMEGMFADPVYGGNKDFAGWRLVGFPGAQPVFTPADMESKQAFTREPIIGLQARPKPRAGGRSHGNRKDRRGHRRRGRGGRHSGGRTRQGRHESDRPRARAAAEDRGFHPHDELRYFQRQDLRPNPKRQPITWRPNANARANPLPMLNYGNQAGGGTVHYGAVSWRFHEDDFRAALADHRALRRGGDPGGFLARSTGR